MLRKILYFLFQQEKNNSSLSNEQLTRVDEVVEAYDTFIPKIFLVFVVFSLFNLFFFFTMASLVLIGFGLVNYFGNINDLLINNDFPQDMGHYFFLAGFIASILSFVVFKMMRWVWRKIVKKPVNEEELKLKF